MVTPIVYFIVCRLEPTRNVSIDHARTTDTIRIVHGHACLPGVVILKDILRGSLAVVEIYTLPFFTFSRFHNGTNFRVPTVYEQMTLK